MGITELFFIAVGLSMDALAVSICIGLSLKRSSLMKCAIPGLYFGGFQAAMPLLGYFLGSKLDTRIMAFDHWIAFVLLGFIGIRMVIGGLKKDTEIPGGSSIGPKKMLPLAVATSIDALAVGVSLAFLQVDILPAVILIGVTTFALSAVGIKVGSVFGLKFKSGAEIFGGAVLVLIGVKTLLEHLGMLKL